MKVTLNFATIVRADVRDALATKLTLFYYKTLGGYRCRLTIFAPEGMRLTGINTVSDEYSIRRFAPADRDFWHYIEVVKYLDFLSTTDDKNVFVHTGNVIRGIDSLIKIAGDIVVPQAGDNHRLMQHASNQLAKHCGMPMLSEEEQLPYNFSAVSLSQEAADFFKKSLQGVIANYPEYISRETFYAILSCIAAHAQRVGLFVTCLSHDICDITSEDVLNSFYAV